MKRNIVETEHGATEIFSAHTCETLRKLGLIERDGEPRSTIVGTPDVEASSMTQFWKKATA